MLHSPQNSSWMFCSSLSSLVCRQASDNWWPLTLVLLKLITHFLKQIQWLFYLYGINQFHHKSLCIHFIDLYILDGVFVVPTYTYPSHCRWVPVRNVSFRTPSQRAKIWRFPLAEMQLFLAIFWMETAKSDICSISDIFSWNKKNVLRI